MPAGRLPDNASYASLNKSVTYWLKCSSAATSAIRI